MWYFISMCLTMLELSLSLPHTLFLSLSLNLYFCLHVYVCVCKHLTSPRAYAVCFPYWPVLSTEGCARVCVCAFVCFSVGCDGCCR